MDLEFRKYLTTFGITQEEYENMKEKEKKVLIAKFNVEQSQIKYKDAQDSVKGTGRNIMGCGCLVVLVPVIIILIMFIIEIIKS